MIASWKIIKVVSVAPLALFFFAWKMLPESPRWLITKNKKEQLVKILDKAAKVNKQHLPIDRILEADEKDDKVASEINLKNATVFDLFWPPTILIRF